MIYGLSTDYEVFLVSRMVEARDRGMSTTEAIRIGTATTGRLITAAALVLAVVAGAFVFSDLVMMKYLAFGLLIALLLDATVVRMFLVPAIMKLLGDDCWWAPKWMKRLQHKIGLGETTLPDERKRAGVEPQEALVAAAAPAAPAAPSARPAPQPGRPAGGSRPRTAPNRPRRTPSPNRSARRRRRRRPPASPARRATNATSGPGSANCAASPRAAGGRRADASAEPTTGDRRPTVTDDATTAIPVAGPAAQQPPTDQIPADETRAIPVSRPGAATPTSPPSNSTPAASKGGGVSAQDLLRREGRL